MHWVHVLCECAGTWVCGNRSCCWWSFGSCLVVAVGHTAMGMWLFSGMAAAHAWWPGCRGWHAVDHVV